MGLAAVGFSALAQESSTLGGAASSGSPLRLQGFGTLGLARSNTDSAAYVRDLSQPDGVMKAWSAKIDSVLAVQANYRLSPQTEAVAQLISRYHDKGSIQPELSWAFLRHDLQPNVSVRAGRLGTEFYMLGDSRLVGYSNVSVRPPPDFYGSLVFSYIDGLDFSVAAPFSNGVLRGKLFAGVSPESTPFFGDISWSQRGSLLRGGYLDYLNGPWQVRYSLAQARFRNEAPTDDLLKVLGDPLSGFPYLAVVPSMAIGGKTVSFRSLGLVYDSGPLNLQFMVNQIRHQSVTYADSRSAYALAAYRVGAVTPYLSVSRVASQKEPLPLSGSALVDALTLSLVSQGYLDQHTVSVGMRWDWRKDMALKLQLDRVRGNPGSLFLVKNPQPDWTGKATVLSVALDFVF